MVIDMILNGLTDKQRMIMFRNAFRILPQNVDEIMELLFAKAVEGDVNALALAFILRSTTARGTNIQEVFKYCEGKYLNSSHTVLNTESEKDATVQ